MGICIMEIKSQREQIRKNLTTLSMINLHNRSNRNQKLDRGYESNTQLGFKFEQWTHVINGPSNKTLFLKFVFNKTNLVFVCQDCLKIVPGKDLTGKVLKSLESTSLNLIRKILIEFWRELYPIECRNYSFKELETEIRSARIKKDLPQTKK